MTIERVAKWTVIVACAAPVVGLAFSYVAEWLGFAPVWIVPLIGLCLAGPFLVGAWYLGVGAVESIRDRGVRQRRRALR